MHKTGKWKADDKNVCCPTPLPEIQCSKIAELKYTTKFQMNCKRSSSLSSLFNKKNYEAKHHGEVVKFRDTWGNVGGIEIATLLILT